eukprot:GHVN01024572.1.p1 GENE.GHVN01024572.1~~GHVN01024572.1.p1  ORF type:complete len:331 (-),score=84.14 GHVN01024572.1:1237-2229(-)
MEIDRRFRCPVIDCNKGYGTEATLLQHIRRKHKSWMEHVVANPLNGQGGPQSSSSITSSQNQGVASTGMTNTLAEVFNGQHVGIACRHATRSATASSLACSDTSGRKILTSRMASGMGTAEVTGSTAPTAVKQENPVASTFPTSLGNKTSLPPCIGLSLPSESNTETMANPSPQTPTTPLHSNAPDQASIDVKNESQLSANSPSPSSSSSSSPSSSSSQPHQQLTRDATAQSPESPKPADPAPPQPRSVHQPVSDNSSCTSPHSSHSPGTPGGTSNSNDPLRAATGNHSNNLLTSLTLPPTLLTSFTPPLPLMPAGVPVGEERMREGSEE